MTCTCQQAMEDALAAGRDGWAAFIETRCELIHETTEEA